MKKIKVSKWIIPQLLIFFIIGKKNFLCAFISIIIHEYSHYLMARSLNIDIKSFRIHLLGATLELDDYEGIRLNDEFIIAIVGPLVNLIIGLIFYIIFKFYNIKWTIGIAEINLTLGFMNLLPAYPLDGAKILKCILCKFCLYKNASKFILYTSCIIGFIISILGIVLIPKGLMNINLILIGIFIIYLNYKNKNKPIYIVLEDLLKKNIRFKKNKYIKNNSISIYYKENVLDIINYIEKNKFNIFFVLDDNMKLLYEIREDEIFNILKEYGNINLEEYYFKAYKKNESH